MGMLHQLEKWSTTHHPRWLVVLRIALGISLTLKGISFMDDSISLQSILQESNLDFSDTWLPIIITWVHLLGGFFITLGLFTRVVTLLLIPVLLGAVFLVNAPKGLLVPGSEFAFSLVVLLLLIFFFVEGGGPLSLDEFLKKYQA
jgi:uncharacterized membrane protein YphA (DoxX/SURF4 family)